MLVLGIAIIVLLTLLDATWRYASPQEPDIAGQKGTEGPAQSYHAGGHGCEESQLARLSAEKRTAEEDRCSEASEDHRIQQANLEIQSRALGISKGNLRLAVRQSWSSFIQTLATVAAFVAAALAAFVAWRAAEWAKQAAIHTEGSVEIAERQLVGASRPNLLTSTMTVSGLGPGPEDMPSPRLLHRMKNYGSGVAWVIHYDLGVCCQEAGADPDTGLNIGNLGYWPIAPGAWYGVADNNGDEIALTKEKCEGILSGALDLYVIGWANYRDDGQSEYDHRFIYKYRRSDGAMVPFPHIFWLHT